MQDDTKSAEPFIATVARAAACDADHLRMAGYSQEKLQDIYNKSSRANKISKYMTVPAGFAAIALFAASTFIQDKQLKDQMLPPLGVAWGLYFVGVLSDPRGRIKRSIRNDALAAGLKNYKAGQKDMKP